MLVVTAEPVGRLGQAEGAHRPGRGWHNPKVRNLGGTRLRLSHPGFPNEEAGALLTVLSVPCRRLFFNNLRSQSTKRQLKALAGTSGCAAINCECHAQTGTCMMRLQSEGGTQ